MSLCFVSLLEISCVSQAKRVDSRVIQSELTESVEDLVLPQVAKPLYRDETYWLMSEQRVFSKDSILTGKILWQWSKDGFLTEELEYKGESNLSKRIVYTLESDNLIVLEQFDGAGKLVSKTNREIQNGLLIKDTVRLPNDLVKTIEEFSWDDQQRKILWTVLAQSGEKVLTSYEYGEYGLQTTRVLDGKGVTVKRFERIYDKGLYIKEQEFDKSNRLIGETQIEYEGTNIVQENKVSPQGVLLSSFKHMYDESGNCIETTFLDRKGNIVETKKFWWQSFTRRVSI